LTEQQRCQRKKDDDRAADDAALRIDGLAESGFSWLHYREGG